jgi:outer membrane protein assembly factor BamA
VTQTIASVEFSDPTLTNDLAVQQHLSEVLRRPYSRLTIDVFLAESIRPIYLEKGYLRAKLGPAEVRLSGDPNKKFPEAIPVYVTCTPGAIYRWKEAEWHGNSALSAEALNHALRLKSNDVANGMALEGGWDRVREAYGHLGYLEAKVEPVASYDDQAHTVSYAVAITEGKQFKYHEMTITGMSTSGENMIREAWPLKPGELMDKTLFEQFLLRLESHHEAIFKDLPIHYEKVGHWLQTDAQNGTVDVLLDFK